MPTVISFKGRAWCAFLLAAALSALPARRARAQAELQTELPTGADRETGIAGRVLDRRNNRGLAEAPVVVQGGGRTRTVFTDAQGGFRALLPPGQYTVRSYFDLYHGARIDGVPVERGKLQGITLLLRRIDEDRDVAVVELEIPYRADTTTAAAQDQLRQAGSGIGEGFGSKQMSQVGASDAGSAAARVVGVSIESSQLVIRGLGGRYNRVLLNGVSVPSVDPDVPGADLDLFPTGVIDSLSVSKTFLPDMPADFAGGVMEIRTISFPRQFTLELGVSLGLSSQSTFRDRVDYEGGRYDLLGFDDGRRALPTAIGRDAPLRSPSAKYPTDQDVDLAAREFQNTWQYSRKTAVPKMGIDMTFGNSRKFGNQKRVGYLATASYEYDSQRKVGTSRPNPSLGSDGALIARNDYQVDNGIDDVRLNALATASLDLGVDHSMTALTLFNRSASDETLLKSGTSDGSGFVEKWQLYYLGRTLWFNQVFGDHRNLFGTRLRLRWAGFHAYGGRYEPDRRTIAYGGTGESREWVDQGGSGERYYSNLDQDDLGANVSARFPLWSQAWGTFGGATQLSSRDFSNRRLRMRKDQQNPDGTVYRRPVEELFSAESIGPLTELVEETRNSDSYKSKQSVYAGYFLMETPLFGPLSLAGGVRAEVLSQEVSSSSPFQGSTAADIKGTDRTDVDYLPGAALKYQLTERMLLRAAYGMTVARPQIRELAPYQYYDFLRDRGVEGNPDLERTLIHNADLRWEWFFDEGQVAAASLFYKNFINPIELTILDSVTGGSRFQNGNRAQNVGAEFEFRLNLGRIASALRLFNLDSNLALVRSRIELPPELSRAVRGNRPLAGQSPYVANLSLRFSEPGRGVTVALVYNVVGTRIADVAARLGNIIPPDIVERPFHALDLVSSVEVGPNLKLKLKVRNILLQKRELRQGDFLIQRMEPGISASLGAAYSY
jgi:outer membrane receptor protein involved in Fe transport